MKQALTVCLTLLTLAVAAQQYSKEELEIRALEYRLMTASQKGDGSTFTKLYSDNYTHTRGSSPKAFSKSELIQSNLDFAGNNSIASMNTTIEKVNLYGNTAVVTGKVIRQSKDKEGRDNGIQAMYTRTWVKGKNGWQAVAGHFTPIPGDPKAAEQEAVQMVEEVRQLMLQEDIAGRMAFIDKNYTAGFVSLGYSGSMATKDSILARNRRTLEGPTPPRPPFERLKVEDLKVATYGDAAVVTGKRIGRSPDQAKAGMDDQETRFAHVLVRDGGQWKYAAFFGAPIREESKVKAQIMALEKRRQATIPANDLVSAEAFDREYLADNYRGINPKGVMRNREEALAYYKDRKEPDNKVLSFMVEDESVQVIGDGALYTAKATIKVLNKEGKEETKQNRVTRTYMRKDGLWKLISHQATEIQPEAAKK